MNTVLISEGVVKLERVQVICPACGQQVEAVASDGQVKGYCAVAKQYVDFPIERQQERNNYRRNPEYRAKLSAAAKKCWQDPEYRAKQRAKISATLTGKRKPLTAETRAKISATLTAKRKPLTAETRAKISAALRGKRRKPLTVEHRAKISATLRGKR